MQWNTLQAVHTAPHDGGERDEPESTRHHLFDGLETDPWVYFVHSYASPVSHATIATCEYGTTFSAAVAHDNVIATQFHPEKSGAVGLHILKNFVNIVRTA